MIYKWVKTIKFKDTPDHHHDTNLLLNFWNYVKNRIHHLFHPINSQPQQGPWTMWRKCGGKNGLKGSSSLRNQKINMITPGKTSATGPEEIGPHFLGADQSRTWSPLEKRGVKTKNVFAKLKLLSQANARFLTISSLCTTILFVLIFYSSLNIITISNI